MIAVSQPSVTGLEKKYVKEAMESEWISSKGPFVERFEKAWADYNGMKHGVACSSGTTALVLALRALGIKSGDEVIVPEFTMVATAWAVNYVGATPVFVDCDNTLNVDYSRIRQAITPKTKAIIPVSIYGRRYDQRVIREARKYELKIIEDLAEAHGTKPRGDIACFSLFGNKIITSGEGGICLTNDPKLAELMAWYRSMCFNDEHTFLHPDIGYNFRMTNLQAAVALAQVERIDELLEKRRQVESWYDKYLPDKIKMPPRDVVWMYDVNVGTKKNEIIQKLKEIGIESRHFFKPMSQQPMYNGKYTSTNAFFWSKRGLYLPTHPDLNEEQVEFISKALISLI